MRSIFLGYPVRFMVGCFLLPLLMQGQTPAVKAPVLPPPWVAHSDVFCMTLFTLQAADVQPLLPAGVEAKVNAEGRVLAGLEIYQTDRVQGIPVYGAAFAFVEIVGHDSANGTPGHWAIWGQVSDAAAAASFQRHFGLPFAYEPDLSVRPEGGGYLGVVGAAGQEVLRLKIMPVAGQPFSGEGIVNMVGKLPDGSIGRAEVPWLSTGSVGTVVQLDITPRGHPALAVLQAARPVWSMISVNQVFSYTGPSFGRQ